MPDRDARSAGDPGQCLFCTGLAVRQAVTANHDCNQTSDLRDRPSEMSFPKQVIRSDDSARAMEDVVLRQTPERQDVVFENRDIQTMFESRTPLANGDALIDRQFGDLTTLVFDPATICFSLGTVLAMAGCNKATRHSFSN